MTVGSLFAGVGGFDLGFERAGFETVFQVEIDPKCREVLAKHFPKAERFEDVREFSWRRPIDVVCGGFPCQDLSVAGKRKGLAGERSGLWWEFHRVLGESHPQFAVLENVPGLLSSNEGRDMEAVVRSLVELGYRVCWRVLDSQYFGVAQRRRRVFIVGSLGDGRAAQVLFEPESVCRDSPPRREAREGATGGVAGSLGASGAGTNRPAGNCNELDFCIPIAGTLGSGDGARGWRNDLDQGAFIPTCIQGGGTTSKGANGSGFKDDQSFCLNNTDVHAVVAPTLSASNDPSRSPQSQEVTQQVESIHRAGYGVRRLTPTECERLQGFPDGWTEGFSDSARYKMMGNAVTVNVSQHLAKRIREVQSEQ